MIMGINKDELHYKSMWIIYVKIFKLKKVSTKMSFLWKNRIGIQQYFYIYTYTQKLTERVLEVELVVFTYHTCIFQIWRISSK